MDDTVLNQNSVSSEPLLCLVNGREQNLISVSDRALAFGDGVFETLLLCKGRLTFVDAHLKRLFVGLKRLQIDLNSELLTQQIENLQTMASSRDRHDGIVKIVVSRGSGRGYLPSPNSQTTVIISLFPSLDTMSLQQQGVAVTLCEYRLSAQPQLAGIKHLNRLDNVMASLEVQAKNYIEGLLFDDQDQLIEAISRNVFLVSGSELMTPLMQNAGVKGVMRDFIIDTLAPAQHITVIETCLNRSQLLAADEVFLCNSVTGIWPVIAVDEHQFSIGSVTQQLQEGLTRHLSAQVSTHSLSQEAQ